MIYATCLNEQQNFDNNNGMLFEMQLLQENLDMSYHLNTRSIINESLDNITAKVSKIIDTIKSFILRLLDTIKAKLNPIITKIKTFFSGRSDSGSSEAKKRDIKNTTIKNVEILEPTDLMRTLANAIQNPVFIMSANINERLTLAEMEERYIKHTLRDSKFKSVSDITDDDLLTVKHEDITKFDNMIYEVRKNTSFVINVFDNIDKLKKDAEMSITQLYKSLTSMITEQDRLNIKLFNLKNTAAVYGKFCNLFMGVTSKYIANINKIINMAESL